LPFRTAWNHLKAAFIRLLHLNDSPHRIALGVAVGMFVALTPTWGIQMLLTVAISWLVRANKVAGLPCAWITNPLTTVPIYSFCYAVGLTLVGGPGADRFLQMLTASHDPSSGWLAPIEGWWDLMLAVAAPLWVGCLVIGAAAAALMYVVMYYLVSARRRHRAGECPSETAGPSP